MTNRPTTVTITGGGGQIGYALMFRIAAGDMFGTDVPIRLRLLEIPQGMRSAEGAALVQRTCLPTSQPNHSQRWRFDASNHTNYRRLVNVLTGRCTAPSNPTSSTSTVLRSYPCSTLDPTWRHQAWSMTR